MSVAVSRPPGSLDGDREDKINEAGRKTNILTDYNYTVVFEPGEERGENDRIEGAVHWVEKNP